MTWIMLTCDDSLLDAMRTRPQTIDAVIQVMQAIDALLPDNDGLKWFNRLYLQVTRAVEGALASNAFGDAPWMAELDVRFAGLYFDAVSAFLRGDATPDCWRADRRRPSPAFSSLWPG